jgi:hypothetical protein
MVIAWVINAPKYSCTGIIDKTNPKLKDSIPEREYNSADFAESSIYSRTGMS